MLLLAQVPRGTVCNRKLTKPIPKLPDRFSLSMEVYTNVPGLNTPPQVERMLFDFNFSLIQVMLFFF
jgi:hypothetical protein